MMISSLVLITLGSIAFSLLNMCRGAGELARSYSTLLMGVVVYILTLDIWAAAITFLGIWIGMTIGWGKGFATIHGCYNRKEKEFYPIDVIVDKLPINNGYVLGTIWMTLRSILYVPTFLSLAFISTFNLFFMLPLLLKGIVYYISGRISTRHGVRIAEGIWGAILGLMILGGLHV